VLTYVTYVTRCITSYFPGCSETYSSEYMNCKKIITAQIAFMVGSMNGFERDFTIELKSSEGLMED